MWRGLLGAALVLSACADTGPEFAAEARRLGPDAIAASGESSDTLATALDTPWGIAVAADGRRFITERSGCLKVLAASDSISTLRCFDVYANDENWHPESGLMGIALHPDFASNGQLFVYGTFRRTIAPRTPSLWFRVKRRLGLAKDGQESLAFENRIIRVQLEADSVRDTLSIVSGIPASHYHAGGALAVGPDGMLYASIGDARLTDFAQDSTVLLGKILRYTLEGGIPADNPMPGSPVWAWGLRNAQGFAWLSDGTLLAIEHGPSGLDVEGKRVGRDELNVIARGGNYGWPRAAGLDGDTATHLRRPILVWHPAVAPAGLAYAGRDDSTGAEFLLVGKLRGGVERLRLERDSGAWRVSARENFSLPALRRVRSVHPLRLDSLSGAGEWLLTTSNRGIRGTNLGSDDLLLRVTLPPVAR